MCADVTEERAHRPAVRWLRTVAVLGVAGTLAAFLAAPQQARAAAAQSLDTSSCSSPGLLLVGMVAEADGLYHAAGSYLARVARAHSPLRRGDASRGPRHGDAEPRYVGGVPHAGAHHGGGQRGSAEPALLYGSLLLANASSLFLPGST